MLSRWVKSLGNYQILRDPIFEYVDGNPDTINIKVRAGKSKNLLKLQYFCNYYPGTREKFIKLKIIQ